MSFGFTNKSKDIDSYRDIAFLKKVTVGDSSRQLRQ